MRLKPVHVASIALLGLGAFMALVFFKYSGQPEGDVEEVLGVVGDTATTRAEKEAAFLAQMRVSESKVDVLEGTGSVLPKEGDEPGYQPNIEVSSTTIDLGVVPNDAPSTHPFPIQNTGTMPLKIAKVQASCNCTTAPVPPEGIEIAPGETEDINIIVDPALIHNFKATRYLTVTSNDPDTPALQLTVSSAVDPEVIVEPEEMDLGEFPKGKFVEGTVIVRQATDEPFVIETVDATGGNEPGPFVDDIAYSFTPLPEDQWREPGRPEYELKASVSDKVPSGELRGMLFVKSGLKRVPWFYVVVKGSVVAPYHIEPVSPAPLPVPNDGVRTADIVIRSESSASIESLSFDPEKVSVEVIPAEPSTEVKLSVKVAQGARPGPLSDPVTFNVVMDGKSYPERVYARSTIPAANPNAATGNPQGGTP